MPQKRIPLPTNLNERNAKLVQYLNEAYGKERELEVALQAHIAMTTKAPYKKRLQAHLRETKAHAKAVERRIKQLGGGAVGSKVQEAVGKAMAATKGPVHMLRGHGEQEKMLKNAKTEYFNEHEEISTYLALETLAQKVGDPETARLAKEIRREEERMAKFLEGQIKSLSGAVAIEEVPSSQRKVARGKPAKRKPARGKPAKRKPAKGKAAKRKPAKGRKGEKPSAKR